MTLRAVTYPFGGGGGGEVISVNGKDGIVILQASDIFGAVRSVNDVLPDIAGNVTLPAASTTVAGVVKVGTGLSISSGVLNSTALGTVKSVNGETPDGAGDVTLSIPTVAPATSSVAGIVKPGTGLSVSVDGTLTNTVTIPSGIVFKVNGNTPDGSGNVTLSIPPALAPATTSVLGGMIVGTDLVVDGSGKVSVRSDLVPTGLVTSVNTQHGDVVLAASDISGTVQSVNSVTPGAGGNVDVPLATTSTFGTMKVGAGLTVSSGTVSYTLPTATTSVKGAVSVGTGLAVSGAGVLSLDYTPSVATISVPGVVRPGSGLSVDGSGTLSRDNLVVGDIPNLPTSQITSGTFVDARIPNLAASKITTGIMASARLGTGTANSGTVLYGDGTWKAPGGGGYTLPEATTSVLGGVIVGSGLSVSAGTISRDSLGTGDIPNLPTSKITTGVFSTARLGTGTAGSINWLSGDGTWKAVTYASLPDKPTIPAAYTLPNATTSVLGGIKVGAGLTATSGVLSRDALVAGDIPNLPATIITSGTLNIARVPSLTAAKTTSGVFAPARLGSGTANANKLLAGDSTWKDLGAAAAYGVSGAIISGNIMATGSDSNGFWVQLDNGFLICTNPSFDGGYLDAAHGAIYRGSSKKWTFPKAFSEVPTVLAMPKGGEGFTWAGLGAASPTLYEGYVTGFAASSVSTPVYLNVLAYGKWK